MKRVLKNSAALALALIVSAVVACGREGRPEGLVPPYADNFSTLGAGSAWAVRADAGNSVTASGGALEFRARANTRAHVQRALGADLVRISCALKCESASAVSLLSLSWDDSNFIQFSLNMPEHGRLNVREVLGTYPHDYDLGASSAGDWRFVAIELGSDCIRYFASRDGKVFEKLRVSARPARLAGPPKLLALGQDSDGKVFARPKPWLCPPALEQMDVSWIRDLRVEATGQAQRKASAVERRQIAKSGRDLAGERELASKDDPSFASVSGHFPAMKWPREVVGVEENPNAIGVAADGSLQLSEDIANCKKPTVFFRVEEYRFGSGKVGCVKKLKEGWMPIVVARDAYDGLDLEQTVFGWSKDFSADAPLLGYVRFCATNTTENARNVTVQLVLTTATNTASLLSWPLSLAPHGSESVTARLPYKILESAAGQISPDEFRSKLADVTAHWEKLVARGSRFEIPEARVQNAYRAWLAYNFLNVKKRKGVCEVCDGSGFYGEEYGYSAALYCNALDLLGYHDRAARYCDSLLTFAHTNGLLAVNSGDTDTGTALWMMAEHYRLTRDKDWICRVSPKMRLMCKWIVDQRHAVAANAGREPALTRGLIRYQPYADLLHPAADYFSNGYLWKGLDATARVFAQIGSRDEAAELQGEADGYLKDIQASMDGAVFEDRGMRILPVIPDTRELWKESDGSADGYYGIIAPCLLEIGVPTRNDAKAKLIVAALEKRGGLVAGVSQFHRMADHAYSYGYWMNCLQRDDVKRTILGLYGSMAYGMSRDTYAAVECTGIRTGENYWMLPHTYSNTQQLRLLRNMLVCEDGEALWLGQAIPRDWLTPGKRVAVNEAPTEFGAVSFAIEAKEDGSMRVQLSPPARVAPTEIMIRLREPRQRKIERVAVDGAATVRFSNETLLLSNVRTPLTMEVAFR